jgi:prepilin-type N-terminal cleavage/methylation domain-containing protein
MKIPRATSELSALAARPAVAAFTLSEVLVAMAIFTILVAGVVAANIYGLKMHRITTTKLSATEGVRKAIGRMADEIKSCRTTLVGDVSTNGVFAGRLNGEVQSGSSLLIQPTTNSAVYTLYFLNRADNTFRRVTSAGNTTLLARQVTNTSLFTVQDHLGNVLTNNQNNRVIHFAITLFQPKRFGTIADYFMLETSVTRRALD